MVKKSKKNFIKLHNKKKYIKDKAIINFILQYERRFSIDFSKIKIPSFFKCLKDDKVTETQKIPPTNLNFNFTGTVTNDGSLILDNKSDLQSISTLSSEIL